MKRAWQILAYRMMINQRDTSVTVKTDNYKQMKNILSFIFIAIIVSFSSCKEDFLEAFPKGKMTINAFNNEEGVNGILIGAYALIDGTSGGSRPAAWSGSVSNWVWGDVASDDVYKGSNAGDQSDINQIERYETLPTNPYIEGKWVINYDGVSRANDLIKVVNSTEEVGGITAEKANVYRAEGRFIRAWHHFELKRVFNNIPYIDETVTDPGSVSNTSDAWPGIEEDLIYAIENLPESHQEVGRATKYAAMAVLSRVYLFEHKYSDAKKWLDEIINSNKYYLMDSFHDNFRIATRNNGESIFEIQFAANDGAIKSFNGRYGDALNFPWINDGGLSLCCGFQQPSQNLVNAFKVNNNGLPLLDDFDQTDLKNDMGVTSREEFIPTDELVDPRLDWTITRRGIPLEDWMIFRGKDYIRDQAYGGPYAQKKNFFKRDEWRVYTATDGWAPGVSSNNYRAYRYAHILLWRAEVAVEENDLPYALQLVNMIRARAANDVVKGQASTYKLRSFSKAEIINPDSVSANYLVKPYDSFSSQDIARKAVRFEERIEFAVEGLRFFDLVRWGIADKVLNRYVEKDLNFREALTGVHFTKGQDEYWPIPQSQIDLSGADILVQNPGY